MSRPLVRSMKFKDEACLVPTGFSFWIGSYSTGLRIDLKNLPLLGVGVGVKQQLFWRLISVAEFALDDLCDVLVQFVKVIEAVSDDAAVADVKRNVGH